MSARRQSASKSSRAATTRALTDLVLGPLLRYVSDTEATVWVETDDACEVAVLGAVRADLQGRGPPLRAGPGRRAEAGPEHPYDVRARRRGALAGADSRPAPECRSHARRRGAPLDIGFGSCRVAVPHEPPYTKSRRTARRRARGRRALGPGAGQSPATTRAAGPTSSSCSATRSTSTRAARGRGRRSRSGAAPDAEPGDEVTDFEEYTWLYQESWREPLIRWLLRRTSRPRCSGTTTTCPTTGTSRAPGSRRCAQRSWWHRRAIGCIASYWIYQHLGNLSPAALDEDEIYARCAATSTPTRCSSTGRADRIDRRRGPLELLPRPRRDPRDLRRLARRPGARRGRPADGRRRGVGLDRRPDRGRLRPPADRDHRALAALPRPRPARGLERAGRATAPTARPRPRAAREAAARGRLRPLGLLLRLLPSAARPARRRRRRPARRSSRPRSSSSPATSTTPTSCEVGWPPGEPRPQPRSTRRSARPTATRSRSKEQRVSGPASAGPSRQSPRRLARLAGAPDPGIRWRLLDGPCFDNQVATLRLDGREASMRLDKTIPGRDGEHALEPSFERRLT